MCGIIAVLESSLSKKELNKIVNEAMSLIRHRGPDWNGLFMNEIYVNSGDAASSSSSTTNNEVLTNALAHERLTIVDPNTGSQPLFNEDKTIVLTVNGEIYNHKTLEETILKEHTFSTKSDCECILHLYEEVGLQFIKYLDGVFSFVLLDTTNNTFIAGRDAIGVNPLYYGYDQNGAIWFASELKVLEKRCSNYYVFPPGHFMSNNGEFSSIVNDSYENKDSYQSNTLIRWYNPEWYNPIKHVQLKNTTPYQIRVSLMKAVKKRLMSDVPYGVLLSGGLDSSLVASIADIFTRVNANKLKTFSIGLEGSPDLDNARKVAKFLGTEHYEWKYTIEEGINAIPDVIRYIETFDLTTVRASTPMYLLARRIKALGVKMVLSGEGADEMFGGYLYFHKAPNSTEFFEETVRKLRKLHYYDCLRANKSMMAWGVETRVPFLDKEFLDVVMTTDPEKKMINNSTKKMEKYILREAFSDEEDPFLPKEVLWRQKEQFSDGVGYGWIDGLKDYANSRITNHEFRNAKYIFPVKTPRSKEEFLYRKIFETHFGSLSSIESVPYEKSVACSTATAAKWDASWENKEDPSGRAVGVHVDAYE